MKTTLFFTLAMIISVFSSPLWSAEEGEGDSKSMQIEKIIAACEEQYKEEEVPDPEERNRMIDQCIDEQTAGNKSDT